MPRFSANLSFLFTEVPFQNRFKVAADAGFKGVEFLFPYEWPAEELAGLAAENGLEIVLFNIWPGDWDQGWRGLAGVPGQEQVFLERLDQALGYARKLGCRRLHAMAGLKAHGANYETLTANLRLAARQAAADGVIILTEPINRRDMPGYLVHRTSQARDVIAAVGAANLRLQFDLYHRHIEEGRVAEAIKEFGGMAAHYQIAAPPDRGEPVIGSSDGGGLDYAPLFKLIDDTGFDGWIGCEYRPRGETKAGLGWLKDVGGVK